MRKFLMLAGAMLIGLAAQAAPGDVFLLQIPGINGTVNFPLPQLPWPRSAAATNMSSCASC